MQIKDVMTRDVEVIAPEATVKEAASIMAQHDVGSLPVCDGRKLLGHVTDRDITIKVTAEGVNPEEVMVADIMTSPVIWAYEDVGVEEAARIMQEHQIRRLVVVDRNKKLAGIVSLGDLALKTEEEMVGETLEEISRQPASY